MDPRTPSSYKSDFQDVERVEKTGKYAVRIIYKQPYAKALTSWGVTILPKHLLESYVKAGKIKEAPQNWSAPVGTGPVSLPGDEERREDRAGRQPRLLQGARPSRASSTASSPARPRSSSR